MTQVKPRDPSTSRPANQRGAARLAAVQALYQMDVGRQTLEDTLAKPGFEGAKWVCSPPIRSAHDTHAHHADLWKGLRMNDIAIVSTDHCPFCMKDQKELGLGNFSKIPNGMGGVEHRMELIYQGVVKGELTLERWVETCSTTPASPSFSPTSRCWTRLSTDER